VVLSVRMEMTDNIVDAGHSVIAQIIKRRDSAQSDRRIKLGLVVEGGGMRGAISAGALVAMERLGLSTVFDEVYAESSGATNSCYFLAGQGDFGSAIYPDYLSSCRFVNPFRLGRIIDVEYAVRQVVGQLRLLDVAGVLRSPSRLFVPLTDMRDGTSRLIDVKAEGIPFLDVLAATCAIVPLYDKPEVIAGVRYADGGIANPIPVASAVLNGCTHILVLLTQPVPFVSRGFSGLAKAVWWPRWRSWSAGFCRAFERQAAAYNMARDLAFGRRCAATGVQIGVLAPSGPAAAAISLTTTSSSRVRAAMEETLRSTLDLFRLAAVRSSARASDLESRVKES